MMRVTSSHLKPLERQVTESVNILAGNKNPRESLNLKSEWGGAKIPSLLVSTPKGLAKLIEETEDGEPSQETQEIKKRLKEAATRGQKRLEYMEEYTGEEETELKEQDEVQGVTNQLEDTKRTGGEPKRARKGGVEPKFPARSPTKTEEDKPGNTSFAEIFWRTRPASWSPGSGAQKDRKTHRNQRETKETDMGTTPVKEKIRRLEEKSKNIRTPAKKRTDRRK